MTAARRMDIPVATTATAPNRRNKTQLTTRPLLRVVQPQQRSLPKVRTVKKHNMRIAVLVATLAVSAVLIVWMLIGYTTVNRMNHEITAISNEITAMEANRDTLSMQLRPYTDEARIEQLAKEKLAMDYPTDTQVAVLQKAPSANLIAEQPTQLATNGVVESTNAGVFGVIAAFISGIFQ